MTPHFKFLLLVLLSVLVACAASRAHACTSDDEDPNDTDWTIRCDNTRT